MLRNPQIKILCRADIIRTIGTFQNVHPCHIYFCFFPTRWSSVPSESEERIETTGFQVAQYLNPTFGLDMAAEGQVALQRLIESRRLLDQRGAQAHATARQNAASPPLNFHGKTPSVM